MTKIYLFDWGNTLMVDDPHQTGKMCHWEHVAAVAQAHETLQVLAKCHRLYVATNAADSAADDVRQALERVGLAQYINGYFCKDSLGLSKDNPEFYRTIIRLLGVAADDLVMVGDSLETDIKPAAAAGLNVVWFNPTAVNDMSEAGYRQIRQLSELCSRYQC
ncbi:HAD family hydrolase [Shewanella yunxiaonensis]|uniref:HAD family hydrolase n=1 Tax=Shewanella yunxiaonensis TaxID=2829809 RepID=A0ABX7YS88_9GAMM|nr:HAD family hydrolase [Shewanella yunxiaonensis]QUN05504.1 HAD family hydrolase [Shewanella yunxiaonensis]